MPQVDWNTCNTCPTNTIQKNTHFKFSGSENAKYVFVLPMPTYDEVSMGRPYQGEYMDSLRSLIKSADINHTDCAFVYLMRCRTIEPGTYQDRTPNAEELAGCRPYFDTFINNNTEKKVIIYVGAVVAQALNENIDKKTNKPKKVQLSKIHGKPIWSTTYNCLTLTIYHPGILSKDPSKSNTFLIDLKQCKSVVEGTLNSTPPQYVLVDTLETFDKAIAAMLKLDPEKDVLAWDTETTSLIFHKAEILCMSFSWKDRFGIVIPLINQKPLPPKPTKTKKGKKKKDEYVSDLFAIEDVRGLKDKVLAEMITVKDNFWGVDQTYVISKLKEVLSSPVKKIGANLQYDCLVGKQNGYNITNPYGDVILLHHLLDENAEGEHDLKSQASLYTDMINYDQPLDDYFTAHPWIAPQNKQLKKKDKKYIYLPSEMLYTYACMDADATLRLYHLHKAELIKQNIWDFYNWLIVPLSKTLTDTEFVGVKVDVDHIKKCKVDLTAEIADLQIKIKSMIGDVNVNSPLQMKKLLYVTFGFPILKYTTNKNKKTNAPDQPSVDKEVLEMYQDRHPVLRYIIQYKAACKLLQTYFIRIEALLDKNNVWHPSFHIAGTVSGRLSSDCQQMPRKDKRPKQIVVARPGYILLEADYGQAEFRGAANYSQDPQILLDLNKGFDCHKIGAGFRKGISIPLNATYEEYAELIKDITQEERQQAKSVIFGILYGMGADKAAKELGIPKEDAELIIKKFFERYPLVRKWLEDQKWHARANGYVVSLFGRRRRLPKINHPDDGIRMAAEREAMNSPIQSVASDLNCHVANVILDKFKDKGLHGGLRVLVHDALLFEVPESEVTESLAIFKHEMENPKIKCNVPLIAEFKKGYCWGDMEKIKEIQHGS